MSKGEHKSKEFLKINPLGNLPVYVNEKGDSLIESGAILLHLAEKYKESVNLIPKNKNKYFQWVIYAVSTLDPLLEGIIIQMVFTKEEDRNMEVVKNLSEKVKGKLEYVASELKKFDYLVDNTFSAADIAIGFSVHLANLFQIFKGNDVLEKYYKSLSSRDAFKRAIAPVESKEMFEMRLKLKKLEFENKKLTVGDKSLITVYHYPGTRSVRVVWLLNEVGAEYKKFNINEAKGGWSYIKSEEYGKINPNHLIPAITYDDKSLWEAGTIMRYILTRFKNNLIPKNWNQDNWAKHHLYEFWTITSIDGKIVATLFGVSKLTNWITGSLEKWWLNIADPMITKDLGDNDYLQGNEFSMTDIFLGYSLTFIYHNGLMKKSSSKIQAYYNRLLQRKAFQNAYEDNFFLDVGVEQKKKN